jgi:hypothetical protein
MRHQRVAERGEVYLVLRVAQLSRCEQLTSSRSFIACIAWSGTHSAAAIESDLRYTSLSTVERIMCRPIAKAPHRALS